MVRQIMAQVLILTVVSTVMIVMKDMDEFMENPKEWP